MLVMLLTPALQIAHPPPVAVTYHNVATAFAYIRVLLWRDGLTPMYGSESNAMPESGQSRIECAPGTEIAVLFMCGDGAYRADGPFVCPRHDAGRSIDPRWRRTLRFRAPPDPSARGDLTWLSATAENTEAWPRCIWHSSSVECWGAPVDERGILVFAAGERAWWTSPIDHGLGDFQSSAWARLIVARSVGPVGKISATIAGPVGPPPARQATRRLDTAVLSDAHAVPLGPASVWVYGEQVPPASWIELRAAGAARKYLPLDEVAHGPPGLPFWIVLDAERALDGVARAAQGGEGAGAVVTLFRLIDPVPLHDAREQPRDAREHRNDAHEQPRRVFVDERVADAAGIFRFEGLGDADYEIVAWHPQLGRGIVAVPRTAESVMVRLESAGQVRGRVVGAGKPLAGVDIISLPDPQAYAQAADLTDVKGGDARTGADGRFVVSMAPGGGGEVRVGGGSHPIRRFPLPRVSLPIVDLGVIDLGAPIDVTIVVDPDPGCEIRATGPVGRSGLQVIAGSRASPSLYRIAFPEEGLWAVELACGREERALTPPVVAITQRSAGTELRFLVR